MREYHKWLLITRDPNIGNITVEAKHLEVNHDGTLVFKGHHGIVLTTFSPDQVIQTIYLGFWIDGTKQTEGVSMEEVE